MVDGIHLRPAPPVGSAAPSANTPPISSVLVTSIRVAVALTSAQVVAREVSLATSRSVGPSASVGG